MMLRHTWTDEKQFGEYPAEHHGGNPWQNLSHLFPIVKIALQESLSLKHRYSRMGKVPAPVLLLKTPLSGSLAKGSVEPIENVLWGHGSRLRRN